MKQDHCDQLQGTEDTYRSEPTDPIIRTREIRTDQYSGLKGHAYIAARGLGKLSQPVQTSAHTSAGEAST